MFKQLNGGMFDLGELGFRANALRFQKQRGLGFWEMYVYVFSETCITQNTSPRCF